MHTPARMPGRHLIVLLAIALIVAASCAPFTTHDTDDASLSVSDAPLAETTAPAETPTRAITPPIDPTATPERTTWDVREFGALPDDGIDDTAEIQATIAAAAAVPSGATVVLPAGVFLIHASPGGNFDGITLKAGVSLVGAGQHQTTLKIMPETVQTGWHSIRLLLVESNTRVADLALDGSRTQLERGRLTDMSTILLRTRPAASNIIWERLYLHDAYSDTREGFAMSVGGATGVTIRDVTTSDNDGSGVSIDGNIYGRMPGQVSIDNLTTHDNGWQGLSFWGATSTVATRIYAYNNGLSGINVEWSDNITIRDAVTYGNGRRGFNTYGVVTNVRVERLHSQGNGIGNRDGAEIGMEAWHWHWPDAESGITEVGIAQSIGFFDCRIRATRGYPHVLVNPDVAGSTTVTPVPHTLILASPGARRWIFSYDGYRVRGSDLREFNLRTYGVDVITQESELAGHTLP